MSTQRPIIPHKSPQSTCYILDATMIYGNLIQTALSGKKPGIPTERELR